MMKACNCLLFALFFSVTAYAGPVKGTVTDEKGNPLAYASISVKGRNSGTTTNAEGKYQLELSEGVYFITCQYVGYARQEKKVAVNGAVTTADFQLAVQQTAMKEVIVKSGGEDPAYAVIRNAIKKRPEYREPMDSFICEAYIKTLMKTRKLPKRVLGQKIEDQDRKEMGVDSTGKGILFLSESLTRISFQKPKVKMEVISGRESGSNGYGFNFPSFINFYENNVNVLTTQFAPRGFVSPIAEGALNYYRYKYLGTFWEDGKEINQIKVIPKRKYEPLFSGTINITEGDWRIHSLDLLLTKEAQLQLLDTMRIRQIHTPVAGGAWRTKDQTVYYTFNILGIDAVGTFLNVYNSYNPHPAFPPHYFNKVVIAYDTAVNKHSHEYWDSVRPVQLEPEEVKDYLVKDSIYKRSLDSAGSHTVRDSLRKHQGAVNLKQIFYKGFSRSNYDPVAPVGFNWQGAAKGLQYNTVEGVALQLQASWQKTWLKQGRSLIVTPNLRYGFNNTHLNAWTGVEWQNRSTDNSGTGNSSWIVSGGKRVSQFNNENPISPLENSLYTLLEHRNYMKIYENYFGELRFKKRFESDLRLNAGIRYENRLPLDNTTDYSLFRKDRLFTPNYPYEIMGSQFVKHQAVIADVELEYQPGQRYIQFPKRKVAIGSSYPTFSLHYTKGIQHVLGSDVNFDKWKFSAWDKMNLKLLGTFHYRLSIGGFFNTKQVYAQDYQHFNGNQLIIASQYLNSFQMAPYYSNSTTASFYTEAHIEHHFNGLLTNKIPLFKKLNWNLVAGANAFRVNTHNYYVEYFAGLENIGKVLRVDVVNGYLNGQAGTVGVRIGFGGLLGSSLRF